jgi:hypothetical protein
MKWIDYVAPQLYWEFSQPKVPFATLIDWWANHAYGRQMFIGHGVYRAFETRSPAWKNPDELPNQIKKLREYPQVQGSIYFSSKTFNRNPNGWNDTLQKNYYKYPAIVPSMQWIDSIKPLSPSVSAFQLGIDSAAINVNISLGNYSSFVKQIGIYLFTKKEENGQQLFKLVPITKKISFKIPLLLMQQGNELYLSFTSISKTNNESALSKIYKIKKDGNTWMIGE